jgi:hypothetical protein
LTILEAIIVPRRTHEEIKDPKSPFSVRVLTFFVEAPNGSESMPAARKIAIRGPQMNSLAAVRWLSSAAPFRANGGSTAGRDKGPE